MFVHMTPAQYITLQMISISASTRKYCFSQKKYHRILMQSYFIMSSQRFQSVIFICKQRKSKLSFSFHDSPRHISGKKKKRHDRQTRQSLEGMLTRTSGVSTCYVHLSYASCMVLLYFSLYVIITSGQFMILTYVCVDDFVHIRLSSRTSSSDGFVSCVLSNSLWHISRSRQWCYARTHGTSLKIWLVFCKCFFSIWSGFCSCCFSCGWCLSRCFCLLLLVAFVSFFLLFVLRLRSVDRSAIVFVLLSCVFLQLACFLFPMFVRFVSILFAFLLFWYGSSFDLLLMRYRTAACFVVLWTCVFLSLASDFFAVHVLFVLLLVCLVLLLFTYLCSAVCVLCFTWFVGVS